MIDAAAPMAHAGGLLATDLVEIVDVGADPGVLDGRGWWFVLADFEGSVTGYRFATVRRSAPPKPHRAWPGPSGPWSSSMGRRDYLAAVAAVRERIAAGDVYQVNLCRLLSADLPPGADPLALAARLRAGNPARYQAVLHTGSEWVVSASPELFLRRDGDRIGSSPIKGTARPGQPFAAKDVPENVMITDLVRNDIGRVAVPGSVTVRTLLARQELPGLAHLVSTVQGVLRPGVGWARLLAAMFPPGSVSGAPKHTALTVISELEPVPRGPYCGAIGYVDADRRVARLAVGIRTFYTSDGGSRVHFGTGAGITWPSRAADEWAETELKARRLVGLAGGDWEECR
ncbi:MAG TPA: chorismate-binding protein [Nakamurella sp.]|jgi:para-aminobenzoate synthetase component 1|nr:chorismate-binding protein [Nakamurella sp.]